MPTMTCERCDGEIEYEVESVDSGDGPWAQSGWVGWVQYLATEGTREDDVELRTTCGCTWTLDEQAALDERATELAGEWTDEP